MAEGSRGHLSDEIKRLVRGTNFGHLATLTSDGAPHADPVWVELEGEAIVVWPGTSSLKAKNTQRDARVDLCILSMDNPYEEAQLRGRVVERRSDRDFAMVDRVSRKYTGKLFPWRDEPGARLVLVIGVDRARYVALPFVHAPASR